MTIVEGASWCVATAAIILGLVSLIAARRPITSLQMVLDLFTAAGLLRLTVDARWTAIAGAALVIAIRQVVSRTLTADLTSAAAARAAGS